MFVKNNNQLVCRYFGETIIIQSWGENSLRVVSSILKEPDFPDWSLLQQPETKTDIVIEEKKATIINGNIKGLVEYEEWEKNRLVISFWNVKTGKLLLKERPSGHALAIVARHFRPYIGGDYQLTCSFSSNEDEKLYGMGQYQQEILDIKGCGFDMSQRNSQNSVPFILSSNSYGFLWHNPAIGHCNFLKNYTEWYAESTKQLDYWITQGDTPKEIINHYTNATGHVPMMPEYGLGFWQCKLRYWTQEQLLNVAREYKKRNLPIDVIVCDFYHWRRLGDFKFESEFYPDPKAMCDELKKMGIKLMVSYWPQVDIQSENYKEMETLGLLVRPERGINISKNFGGFSNFVDATNPRAREYIWNIVKKNYVDKGVDLFWLDNIEPDYDVYDFDNYRYSIGPNVQCGNIYPQLLTRGFYEGMTKELKNDNVVSLCRCCWSGSQRYGALVWSGDIWSNYEDLRKQICAGIHMGICGIAWWTTDIGGFNGGDPNDPFFRELLIRWFQFGAFCPVMRLHGNRLPTTQLFRKDGTSALFTGGDNEVWSYGEEAYEIIVKLLKFRELMRPYTRECMKEAHEKGTPVIRGLFCEFPEQPICWDIKDQYMFGPDVLVAPVLTDKARERKVFLPAGAKWMNANNGEIIEGGKEITVTSPLSQIPVFLRDEKHKEWVGQI